MEIFNVLLLLSVCSYGITFGVANWCKGIWCVITGRTMSQNDLGKILDGVWLISVIYLGFVIKYGTESVVAFIMGVM